MKIGIAADFHLDKRLGGRTDPGGINLRSLDMEQAVIRVIDGFIAQQVEIAIVLGDLFDNPRPSERARQFLTSQLLRLHTAAPETLIALLGGNHEAPASFLADTAVGTTGVALPEIAVVDRFATTIVRRGPVSLTMVPWMRNDEELISAVSSATPEPGQHNLLLLHAGLADLDEFAQMRPGSQTLTRALLPAGFDHIFSGHFHGHRDFPDLGFTFIGSPERLSVAEAGSPKGFVVWDTDTCRFTFHPIATRSWYQLGVIDGRALSANGVVEILQAMAATLPDWSEALVTVRVEGLTPEVYAAVDQARITRLRLSAFRADIELHASLPEFAPDEAVATDPETGPLLLDLDAEWRRWATAALPGRSPEELTALIERGANALREAAGG
jgi:DNA repair exonuclease SbcCD nuclease subunit